MLIEARFLQIAVLLLSLTLSVQGAPPAEQDIAAADWTIIGQLVDEKGQPIVNGKVQARFWTLDEKWPDPSSPAKATSDQQGRIELKVPLRAAYTIEIEIAGREHFRTKLASELAEPGKNVLDLGRVVLGPERVVSGRVVDPAGNPIAGAHAWIVGKQSADSDDQGIFSLSSLSRTQPYEILVTHREYEGYQQPLPAFDEQSPNAELEITLFPLAILHGILVDDRDEPIADAEVVAERQAQDTDPENWQAYNSVAARLQHRSKSDGTFEIFCQDGLWNLHIEHPQHAKRSLYNLTLEKGPFELDLGRLELDQGLELKALVLDPEGQGIPGATVDVFVYPGARRPHEPNRSATTDPQGQLVLSHLPRQENIELSLHHPDYIPVTTRLEDAGEETHEIVLKRGGEVLGIVVDQDGQPVAGAEITTYLKLEPRTTNWQEHAVKRQSDSTGSFILRGLEFGTHAILVQAEGFSRKLVEPVAVTEAPIADLRVVLDRPAHVIGQVTDARGQVIAGLPVGLSTRLLSSSSSRPARTDDDGRFDFFDVPTGPVTLTASHEDHGRASRKVVLTSGTQTHDLQLEPWDAANFSGYLLTSEPHTFNRETIHLTKVGHHHQLGVDQDGSFKGALEPGTYELAVHGPVLANYLHPDPIEITEGPSPPIEIYLPRGAAIVIDVHGVHPAQIPDLNIMTMVPYSSRGSRSRAAAQVGPARFRLGGLSPGEWTITAQIGGSRGRSTEASVTIESPGEEQHIDLKFDGGFTLTGQVIHNGLPAVQGQAILAPIQASLHMTYPAPGSRYEPLGLEGRFHIDHLEAGTYSLEIELGPERRYAYDHQVEIPSDQDVLVELRTFDLRGRVVSSAGEPLTDQQIHLAQPLLVFTQGRTTTSAADGHFAFQALAPGRYHLRVLDEGFAPQALEVEITDRSIEDLELVLSPPESFTLTVRLLDDLPDQVLICQFGLGEQPYPLHCGDYEVGEGRVQLTSFSAATEALMISAEGSGQALVTVEEARRQPVTLRRGARLQLDHVEPSTVQQPTIMKLQLISSENTELESVFNKIYRAAPGFPFTFGNPLPFLTPGTWQYRVEDAGGKIWEGTVELVAGQLTRVVVE